MTRRLALLLAAGLLAGCGGSSKPKTTSTTAVPSATAAMQALIAKHPALAGKLSLLYEGPSWAVVQSTGKGTAAAVAFRLRNGRWVADRSGSVNVQVIGPRSGTTTSSTPQVAIELKAHAPLVETGLWVDGQELLERGGGTPKEGTIYGSPVRPLRPGAHVAVGYGRTTKNATAAAWVFRVRGS